MSVVQNHYQIMRILEITIFILGASLVVLASSTNSAFASTVNFLSIPSGENWTFFDHGLEIEVLESVGVDPLVIDNISVDLIRKNSALTEVCRISSITFYETDVNSQRFLITPTGSAYVNLTSADISPDCDLATLTMQVQAGDKVEAAISGIPLAIADIVDHNSWGTLPTLSPARQPDTGSSAKMPCSSHGGDTDGDFVCNDWEDQDNENGIQITRNGITYIYYCKRGSLAGVSGDSSYTLGTQQNPDPICPTTSTKDVFVEIDWLKRHGPSPDAINDVVSAFANAFGGAINLHVQADEEHGYHDAWMTGPTNGNPFTDREFDDIKEGAFGLASERDPPLSDSYVKNLLTAKRQVFHYGIFGHFQGQISLKGSSGVAEDQGGNDFLVTLGSFTGGIGSRMEQASTFMHELGHNMKLNHGGQETTQNCEPNYLSIMSYSRQFTTMLPDRALDYSREVLPTITEGSTSINEVTGIPSTTGEWTVWGIQSAPGYMTELATSNMNFDADMDFDVITNDGSPYSNLNYLSGPRVICAGAGTILTGYNDWSNLWYDVRNAANGVNNWGD